MVSFSLNLPSRYKMVLSLGKRRGPSIKKGFIENLVSFMRKRGGTKFSRFLRFFFERYRIKNFLGANLIILSFASSFLNISNPVYSDSDSPEFTAPVVLTTQQGVRVPLEAKNITQGYWSFHRGVDLNGKTGDFVYPISGGTIETAEFSTSGYGKVVIVDHGNEYKSLYAHLSKIDVSPGQKVDNETKLGEVGATGRAFGDHLHLEVYEDGEAINPLTLLPK